MSKIGSFKICARSGKARAGSLVTAHGAFNTPAFMPVGTQATVKGMTPDALVDIGSKIILSNTYHLHLRPGDEVIRDLGGLHTFMGWNGPILTDSGGYQVFSLSKLREVSSKGVTFRSHIDGSLIEFTPERVIAIQENLGVDIMMVLDECLEYPATRERAERSLELTMDWAKRSLAARTREDILVFGIVQGGAYADLRQQAARGLESLGFDGYAVGGLSVGEPQDVMDEMMRAALENLPEDKVRYLMGVGTPSDIVRSVLLGVDMFDCVIPTRSARFGRLFTSQRFINIRNEEFKTDIRPIDGDCDCYTCKRFSRAYLSHLRRAKESLFVQLGSIHNLRFYQRLMSDIRKAIVEGTFTVFAEEIFSSRTEQGYEDNLLC